MTDTLCPVCGEAPVEFRRQMISEHRPHRLVHRGGEERLVCQHGHFFTLEGEDAGLAMPPDVTLDFRDFIPHG